MRNHTKITAEMTNYRKGKRYFTSLDAAMSAHGTKTVKYAYQYPPMKKTAVIDAVFSSGSKKTPGTRVTLTFSSSVDLEQAVKQLSKVVGKMSNPKVKQTTEQKFLLDIASACGYEAAAKQAAKTGMGAFAIPAFSGISNGPMVVTLLTKQFEQKRVSFPEAKTKTKK